MMANESEHIKRPYYPPTSYQQRLVAMQVWEGTGDWQEACRRSGISKDTFYKWRPRYLEKGKEGLIDDTSNRAPNHVRTIPAEMSDLIVKLKRDNKDWGKLRIAQEVGRRGWPQPSKNTVRRVLIDHGDWHPDPPLARAKASARSSCRRA